MGLVAHYVASLKCYRVRIRTGQGQRRAIYGATASEAEGKAAAFLAAGAPSTPKMTVAELLARWQATQQYTELSAQTHYNYERAVVHIIKHSGSRPVDDLTPDEIDQLLAAAGGANRFKPRHIYRTFNRALKVGLLRGWVTVNPLERVEKPKAKAVKAVLWTEEQQRLFLRAAAGSSWYPLWTVLSFTGCRFGEAAALRWADIDEDAKVVRIERSITRVAGQWYEGRPKTDFGVRTFQLTPALSRAFGQQRALQARWRDKAAERWREEGRIFTDTAGGPLPRWTPNLALRRLCASLKLPHTSNHKLRHLFATQALYAGVSLPEVSSALGHSSVAVTAQVYAHILRRSSAAQNAVERRLLGEAYTS